jgi:AraC-like DNA-binding protein
MQASAFLLRAIYMHLRDEGLPTDAFVRHVTPEMHAAQHYRVLDFETLSTAIQLAHDAGATPDLALKLGSDVPLRTLGMFGELLMQCPTLRDALTATKHFMPLLQPDGQLVLTESGSMAALHYEPTFVPNPGRRFAIELFLSLSMSVARRFVGKTATPRGVLLPYSAPKHRDRYEALFGCPLVFGAHTAAIIFDREMLDLEQPFADLKLREMLEHELELLLSNDARRVPVHLQVRAVFEQLGNIEHEPCLDDLGARLGLTRRALRRRLAEEGHTFSGLFQDFRKQRATQMVTQRDIPFKSIAAKMGYSDKTAFHRAFKRWTGMTPAQYRHSQDQRTKTHAAA